MAKGDLTVKRGDRGITRRTRPAETEVRSIIHSTGVENPLVTGHFLSKKKPSINRRF